jgi:hypothetical protein
MRFVGDDVGALAAGSKVLPSVVLIHYGPTNGVVCQVLFHPGKPSVKKQSSFSMVRDTVASQWEVAEGVLGSIGGT